MCETLEAEHAKSYFQQRLKDARRLGTGLFLTDTRLNVDVRMFAFALLEGHLTQHEQWQHRSIMFDQCTTALLSTTGSF